MPQQAQSLLQDLTLLFRDVFLDDGIQLSAGTTANDIVGWDSMANISLMLAVQSKYRVKFTTRDIESFQTVGDLASCLAKKLSSPSAVL